ncbi:MAG: hypothetical protein R3193_07455 [Marinobacter sp.]|nr:hypothetical protein [Marinobacter sp.]
MMETETSKREVPPVQRFDPQYVQVSRKEAAAIIGRSPTEFDRLRKNDTRCPKGHKAGNGRMARVMFRLSDVYRYSEKLIEDAQSAEGKR